MCRQNKRTRQQSLARWGLAGLALGAGYALIRMQRKAQVRRWNTHLARQAERTALVTGASAGIGRAYAEHMAKSGYNLVIAARRAERLEAQAADWQLRYGVRVEALPADLSTEAGITRLEERLAAGDIDFLVNNAGYDEFGNFSEIPIEKLLGLIQCMELATVRFTHAALPGMLERRRGAVVNVSSIGAFTAKRKDAIYVASKAFINRFTETLALELKGTGVRVQALCPGFTLTEFHDAPEYAQYRIKERIPGWLWMTPEQVVEKSLRALGEDRVVTVPGLLNQVIAAAGTSGMSKVLMQMLAAFFPKAITADQPKPALDMLACPECSGKLNLLEENSQKEVGDDRKLVCLECNKTYAVVDGIPRFAPYEDLEGANRSFAGMYDWFSIVYRLFSKVAFAYIGMTEDDARHEILDKLEPCGKVLEVSVGPGVNLPYLREFPAVKEIYGLDLSNGQLARCRSFAARQGWPVSLYQGNAEALPFQDAVFDSVFHVGGINFFSDKGKAIREMIRVAKQGARIVICDETERGARGYEITLPGFKQSFKGEREVVVAPVDLVPPEMEEVKLDESVWKGWFYTVEFRKPE